MPHATHQRHRTAHHGAHHALVVERPQVFERTTTPAKDGRIERQARAVCQRELGQRLHDLSRGLGPLHRSRDQHHLDMRHPASQRDHDVAPCRSSGRGDHRHAARKPRQVPLAGGVKKTLGFQTGLQPQELLVQRPRPSLAHAIDDELQLASSLVNGQLTSDLNQHPVCWLEIDRSEGAAEHRATQRRLPMLVLEREVRVPGSGSREAAELSAHHAGRKARRQRVAHGLHKRRNRPDACAVRA